MFRLAVAMAVVLALCSAAGAQVSRPHPSATPQIDKRGFSVPILATPAPGCTPGRNYFFGDTAGCIYACAGSTRQIVAGTGCAMPTGALTATPTPTVTPTLTPTPTVTVTP